MVDKARYNQVLSNPEDSDKETIAQLIAQYPYVQSLRFIHAKKQHENQLNDPLTEALLYTNEPSWLYGQIMISTPEDETAATAARLIGEQPVGAIDEQEEIAQQITRDVKPAVPPAPKFSFDDPEAEAADEILAAEQAGAPMPSENEFEQVAEDDDLLPEQPIAMDYIAHEGLATEEEELAVEEEELPAEPLLTTDNTPQEVVPLTQGTPHEKVSLYDDQHMPYSFLWWLNKTRIEHAHTYRPYVSHPDTTMPTPDTAEKVVLDQQIRENIFHLQSPEDKLSNPQTANTVPFQLPPKIDPVIERFIREEPQIKPPQPDKINLENKARQSAEDQSGLVTETLAKIYEEQGLYPKAIAVYKKLSLKYPEKSGYFAALINAAENKLT